MCPALWDYDLILVIVLSTFFLSSSFLLCNFNHLNLNYILSAFWHCGEGESWAPKWQLLTDLVAIKNLLPTSHQWGWGAACDRSCIGQSLDCRIYRWKHGHFVRLVRTQAFWMLTVSWRSIWGGGGGVNGSWESWLRHITHAAPNSQ